MEGMKVHRFFVGEQFKLKKDFWVHEESLLWQWNKVLRFRAGQQLVLFDGLQTDRLYEILELKKTEAHLVMRTELDRVMPKKHIYLLWSLLKKDNNDLVLQKCTELGISNFVPIISERSIRKDFNLDRARRIIIEASEQCGRSAIPFIREPVHLQKAIDEYKDKVPLFIAHHGESNNIKVPDTCGALIGPEGGWSQQELELFKTLELPHMSVSEFTLRAETAAVATTTRLLQ